MKVLEIESSPLVESSVTRKLTATLIAELKSKFSGLNVTTKDLSKNPLPHVDALILSAYMTPEDKQNAEQKSAIKHSNEAVKELLDSDLIIISAPMWNFGIPSVLKAWVDHVARAGLTFKYTEKGPVGLVPDSKKVIIISSRGGIYSGDAKHLDHQESHLVAFLQFLGIKNIQIVTAEGVAYGPDAMAKAIESANNKIKSLVSSM